MQFKTEDAHIRVQVVLDLYDSVGLGLTAHCVLTRKHMHFVDFLDFFGVPARCVHMHKHVYSDVCCRP